jgi:hypothetical protein
MFRDWSSYFPELLHNTITCCIRIGNSIHRSLKEHFTTELTGHLGGVLAPSGLLVAAPVWHDKTRSMFIGRRKPFFRLDCRLEC